LVDALVREEVERLAERAEIFTGSTIFQFQ
jgi:hypothetical protein